MKRCPHCAEAIQDEAVICRYCRRRVRVSIFKKILLIIVIMSTLIFVRQYRQEILNFVTAGVSTVKALYELVLKAPESLKALSEYGDRVKAMNKTIDSELVKLR